jgi:mevalonate kinase
MNGMRFGMASTIDPLNEVYKELNKITKGKVVSVNFEELPDDKDRKYLERLVPTVEAIIDADAKEAIKIWFKLLKKWRKNNKWTKPYVVIIGWTGKSNVTIDEYITALARAHAMMDIPPVIIDDAVKVVRKAREKI